ncbi:MAG: type II toxin-antitoxin system RelE family toxin [Candidatus Nanoarchaeia archaeon]
MSYDLFFEKEVTKFLSKVEKETASRIVNKIELLKENPFSQDAKRIVNTTQKIYRIRVGKYRILYRIEDNILVVVFLVDKRSKVYKK